MKQNPIRNSIFVALAAVLILNLSGCGSESNRGADGRTTVTFWHSFVSGSIPALNRLIEKFEEEHPEIRIRAQYVPTGDALIQRLVTAVQSRTAPDISWVRADYMEDLARAEAIYDMNHFIDGEAGLTQEEMDDIYPALLTLASWRGTLYSMPMQATNLAIIYNKELFRQAGLDPERPPQTWNELEDYARRLTIDKTGNGRLDQRGFLVPIAPAGGPQGGWMTWQWYPFLWQGGGDVINEQQTEVLYNGEGGVRALSFWKRLYDAQDLRNFTGEPDVAFVSGQVAMHLDGPWNLPRYPQLLRNIDWAIAPMPAGPEARATVMGGEYLAVFRQTNVPEEAWTFIKWMIRPDVQSFWGQESGYLPVRQSVREIPEFQAYLEENPNYRVFVESLEFARATASIDYHGLQIGRHIAEALEQATVGRRDPAEVLNNAAERSNQLLRQVARTEE